MLSTSRATDIVFYPNSLGSDLSFVEGTHVFSLSSLKVPRTIQGHPTFAQSVPSNEFI